VTAPTEAEMVVNNSASSLEDRHIISIRAEDIIPGDNIGQDDRLTKKRKKKASYPGIILVKMID
jgi:hypothetical protein